MQINLQRDGAAAGKIKWTAILFMGLSHIIHLKQYLKGCMFALIEILFLLGLPVTINKIIGLITLGSPQPDLPVKLREHSIFMLIDGVIFCAIILIFLMVYYVSVKSALKDYKEYCSNGFAEKEQKAIGSMANKAFPVLGLAPAVLMIVFFVVVPLVFSACVAFTNYSAPNHIPPNNTVDWVGLDNFIAMFGGDATWSSALGRVALWTLVWAILATTTCYVLGLIVAVVMKEYKIKIAPVFRFIFILPYAVPAVVSMLVWQNLLNGSFGIINRTLMELGLITEVIPWLSDAWLAKFTVVLVNLWAGFPYFMLLIMGTMTAISQDVYEAATIDGANKGQIFKRITLPLVLYQTTPLIIMSFTHNINNFGSIFFLSGGSPVVADTTITSAGGTDIIVSWIYKLTVTLMKYNFASVLAIMVFVVLAPFAIWSFRRTKSYKEGEV